MRLDLLKIKDFKNLADVVIDFDENELTTVLIGANGTGKSNIIEALVTIFRDVDLDRMTPFRYRLIYRCRSRTIEIDNERAASRIVVKVDGRRVPKTEFTERKDEFLPTHVFGYYSGASRRLEQLFDDHQSRYYRQVIDPKSLEDDRGDVNLRRLFYCRASYGQLCLLTYFAFGDAGARAFLRKNMKIVGFESALIVLRKPRWAGSRPTAHRRAHGDKRFWYAAGMVRRLLDPLWECALAPIVHRAREREDYRDKATTEEQLYIFIRDHTMLEKLAQEFGSEKEFFSLLETLDISGLIREVRIWVIHPNADKEIPFHEISDGEKQLLSVLGLMRFTGQDESLFLLDEPDTHLNPAWKWDYLGLVKEVARRTSESHIIMTSHDPLTLGALKASQVQVMAYEDAGDLRVQPPTVEPRGLGFTSILTEIFGLPTTVDPETQELLDERNRLLRVDNRSNEDERRLIELSGELRMLGFLFEDREPEYAEFLRALENVRRGERGTYTPEEIMSKNEAAKKLLEDMRRRLQTNQ